MIAPNILPFTEKNFATRYSEGVSNSNYANNFETAVKECQKDTISIVMAFKFDSTLEINEKLLEEKRLILERKLAQEQTNMKEKEKKRQRISETTERKSRKSINDSNKNDSESSQSCIVPRRSKYFIPYQMIKTNISAIHPVAVESIKNVINAMNVNNSSSDIEDDSSNLVTVNYESLSKLFPFKMANYCNVIRNHQEKVLVKVDKRTSSSDSNRSPCPLRKKSQKNGLNRGRIHCRKQSNPVRVDIKRIFK